MSRLLKLMETVWVGPNDWWEEKFFNEMRCISQAEAKAGRQVEAKQVEIKKNQSKVQRNMQKNYKSPENCTWHKNTVKGQKQN